MTLHRIFATATVCVALGTAAAIEDMDAAFQADDQCAAGDEECAVSAIQLRGQKVAETAAVEASSDATDNSSWPSCQRFGCADAYVAGRVCQCTASCMKHVNCCPDYWHTCWKNGAHHSGSPSNQMLHSACYHSNNFYQLNMEAKGDSFFDHFTFVTQDDVHGAHQFTSRSEAKEQGTTTTEDGRAQLRFGGLRKPSYDGEAWKRYSVNLHTNQAWNPAPGFLAVLHYKSLPHGCGVWPSFWAMNSDGVWPKGGELDILEYANDEKSKVSFHIDSKCFLDKEQVEKCAPQGHTSLQSQACETNYFENKLGCLPHQRQLTGREFSNSPGIMAAEWASDHVTIFHIPEAEIPQDLKSDHPKPASWGKWVVAYLPFKGDCNFGPQELVLNMQLCGDWAGASWTKHTCQAHTGLYKGICDTGLSQPSDCCTKWVTSDGWQANREMKSQVFDIESLKVYTANGAMPKNSGTFVRGGLPVQG